MIIFEANIKTMKRLLTTLAAIATLASCVEAPETNVIEHGEGYVIERTQRLFSKKKFRVRKCCTLYDYKGKDSVICATNNGRCDYCEPLCAKWGQQP